MTRFQIALICIPFLLISTLNAQVILNADGPGETYELINSVLAPGYNVIEVPDCAHPDFGRHIEEVFDSVLNKYVFKFHMHVTPDNDRCINFDRQRNEIKSYDKSPDNLKAVKGEIVEYIWRFKIDSAFQSSSSFTHLHQLKAVGGSEDSMPLITLTARKGNPDKLQVRYAKNTSQTTIYDVPLDPFKGSWVEVQEIVTYGERGKFQLIINRLSDSTNLLTYSREDIRMWKTDASFIRPKWGIYRSLNVPTDLRDEMVYFSDFWIDEDDTYASAKQSVISNKLEIYPNPANDFIQLSNIPMAVPVNIIVMDQLGRTVLSQSYEDGRKLDVSTLVSGVYFVQAKGLDGTIATSKFLKQ